MLISIKEWAIKNGINPDTARQKILRGNLPEAQKIGRNWVIDEDVPNQDKRIKSGKYINARKSNDEK
jgi:hypothetical protein